ncbi:hypothetical protein OJAV_G00216310 [Oryzias javanicus]|uniref:Uncharacterized protein n=1 Tax=Oryzias javanicus TaxID=123683 RepID=A0A437C468_ORYJA|nr:hypothetical protein OJAV_G00216310 [Oryzias javanicus]
MSKKLAPRIPSSSVSPHHRSGRATKAFMVQRAVQQKPHKHTDSFLKRGGKRERVIVKEGRRIIQLQHNKENSTCSFVTLIRSYHSQTCITFPRYGLTGAHKQPSQQMQASSVGARMDPHWEKLAGKDVAPAGLL